MRASEPPTLLPFCLIIQQEASVGIHCEGERVTSSTAAGGLLQEVAGCRMDDYAKFLFL